MFSDNPDPNDQDTDLDAQDQGDDEETVSSEEGAGSLEKRIWPYRDERQIMKAAEQYVSRNTQARTKRQIMDRLLVSRPLVTTVIPMMMDHFHLFEMGVRHTLLDLFQELVDEDHCDLTPIADTLAKHLSDANFGLREKVAQVMVAMGPQGFSATARICGYLRHNLPDIRIAAANVLGAIGPVCAKMALPKLDRQYRASRDDETKEAVGQAMARIRKQLAETGDVDETKIVSPEELKRIRATSKTPTESTVLTKYPSLKKKRILVAEDEPPMRKILSHALKSAGCEVHTAAHGKEALEILLKAKQAGTPIDGVVLDLMMPVMNGGDFLKAMRSIPDLKDTSVFVVSARQERAVIAALAKLRIQGFFPKPYNIASLLDKMDAHF